MLDAVHLLPGLVALAGNDDRIATAGTSHGITDGSRPIGDLHHFSGTVASTDEHGCADHRGIFSPRVVVGDHQQISPVSCLCTHHRTLAGVPVSTTAQYHQ